MTTARMQTRWVRKDATDPDTLGDRPAPASPRSQTLLDKLLAARGITDADAAQRFLNPKLNELIDPAHLPGAVRAAQRLRQAVDDQQPIVVYGDYDVDGITASAILFHTLKLAGARVTTYVPHRLEEGYGLNEEAIRHFAQAKQEVGLPLVVSVDCGITATGPARVARELGIDLIITDHHTFDPDDLPQAHTLVHPAITMPDAEGNHDCTSDINHQSSIINHDLCGAGVAYKVAWQFAREFAGCAATETKPAGKLPDKFRGLLMDLLALAALGTVADVVPLVDENRIITCFGLSRIKKTNIAGLNALIEASNLAGEKIDSYHVGFVLGPRLNACGRMGHAKEAVELLTTAQGERAKELAEQLHHTNEDRQQTQRQIVASAIAQVEAQGYDADDQRAIVVAADGWHPGVVGIVASRLVDQFHRPAIVLGIDPETGIAKGSARSVDGVSIHVALTACSQHLTKFGGHAMAAGLTLDAANIDALRDALITQVNGMLTAKDLCACVRIDAAVGLGDCDIHTFDDVQRLAPFGRSNPKPRLLIERVTLARPAQRMGAAGKHLSMQLRQGDTSLRAVAWSMGDRAEELPAGVTVDVVFQPNINTWQGRRSAELHVIDLRVV